jgi:putative phosphoesterase
VIEMKIGVISDVHGNLYALQAVLGAMEREGVERIVNAGDDVGYSAFPGECVELIQRHGIDSVAGNYDHAVGFDLPDCGCGAACDAIDGIRQASLAWTKAHTSAEVKRYLSGLPELLTFETDAGKAVVMHGGLDAINQHVDGNAASLNEIASRTGALIVIMGHTHRPFVKTVGGTVFVNPGSVGKPCDGDPRASYGIIEISSKVRARIERIQYPVERNVTALIDAGLPGEIGRMLLYGSETID